MRLASYGLALIAMAGLTVVLPFSSAQMAREHRAATVERVVFVDRARLAELHPAWEALREMKSTLREVRGASNLAGAGMACGGVSSREVGNKASRRTEVSRLGLETDAARSAMRAFQQLDADARDALAMRVSSMRAVMMKSAEASRMAKALEIESGATRDVSAADRQYSPSQLSARLKLSALRTASVSAGVDPELAQSKVQSAQARLEGVDDAWNAKKDEITAEATRSVDTLRKADTARIESQVRDYEIREDARIRKSAARAQDETLLDLSGLNAAASGNKNLFGHTKPIDELGKRVSTPAHAADVRSLRELRAAVSALENRIREDVDRAVKSLASREGVKVTFARGGSGIEDATGEFRDLVRRYSWRAYRPVLSEARGS